MLSVCLSPYLSVYIYIGLYIYLFCLSLSIYLYVYPSIYLGYLYMYLCIYLLLIYLLSLSYSLLSMGLEGLRLSSPYRDVMQRFPGEMRSYRKPLQYDPLFRIKFRFVIPNNIKYNR